jgi:hypothetical protein
MKKEKIRVGKATKFKKVKFDVAKIVALYKSGKPVSDIALAIGFRRTAARTARAGYWSRLESTSPQRARSPRRKKRPSWLPVRNPTPGFSMIWISSTLPSPVRLAPAVWALIPSLVSVLLAAAKTRIKAAPACSGALCGCCGAFGAATHHGIQDRDAK